MVQRTDQKHVVVDEAGTPFIEGTRFKVRELVKSHLAYGWSPDELQLHYPDLSLAQVYAALAYYYDHESNFREEIDQGLKRFDEMRSQNLDSPVRRPLKALGRL